MKQVDIHVKLNSPDEKQKSNISKGEGKKENTNKQSFVVLD